MGLSAKESEMGKNSVLDQITKDYKSALNAKLNQREELSVNDSKSALNLQMKLRALNPTGTIP